jgi:hypothetical protein
MQKFAILMVIAIGVISGAAVLSSQSSYAQQDTTMPINFTKLFSENKEFQQCIDSSSMGPLCAPYITVLYEDQSTVALKSGYVDVIWKGVAEVKKYGYKIDGMTSFPISDYTGDTKVNILVVMSK